MKNKCKSCLTVMITDNDIVSMLEKGTYLEDLWRVGLTNSSDEHSEFVFSVFVQTEVIDKQLRWLQSARKVCCLILDKSKFAICLRRTYPMRRKKIIHFVENTYSKNKQKFSNEKHRQYRVKVYKSK